MLWQFMIYFGKPFICFLDRTSRSMIFRIKYNCKIHIWSKIIFLYKNIKMCFCSKKYFSNRDNLTHNNCLPICMCSCSKLRKKTEILKEWFYFKNAFLFIIFQKEKKEEKCSAPICLSEYLYDHLSAIRIRLSWLILDCLLIVMW